MKEKKQCLMAWTSSCLLVQVSTTACKEKSQSFQNVVCYSTNTATVSHTVNDTLKIPLYIFCQRITDKSASMALRALQEENAGRFAHTCSVVALCWVVAEHLVQNKRTVTSLWHARVGDWYGKGKRISTAFKLIIGSNLSLMCE